MKIGDLVTRKKYHNDIIFKIIDIDEDIYYLKGMNIRLYADSDYNDLVLYDNKEDVESELEFLERINEEKEVNDKIKSKKKNTFLHLKKCYFYV